MLWKSGGAVNCVKVSASRFARTCAAMEISILVAPLAMMKPSLFGSYLAINAKDIVIALLSMNN